MTVYVLLFFDDVGEYPEVIGAYTSERDAFSYSKVLVQTNPSRYYSVNQFDIIQTTLEN